MGIFSKLLVAGAVGLGINQLSKNVMTSKKEAKKEIERKSNVCKFDGEINKEEFRLIVEKALKNSKRIIGYSIKGPIINCKVLSQTGSTTWSFKIDFNDYGRLTGRYWLFNSNLDSTIPTNVAEKIKNHILNFPDCLDDEFKKELLIRKERILEFEQENSNCPYCGTKIKDLNSCSCKKCGRRLSF